MITDTLPLELIVPPAGLSCLAVLALVVSDFRKYRPGRYLFKPLAALSFVWLAVSLGATASSFGTWLLAGLVLCLIGDLFLMFEQDRFFLGGLVAFLCGHLLYVIAFTQIPANLTGLALSVVPALALLGVAARWLAPHVERDMRLPVAMYGLVITAMILGAGLSLGQAGAPLIIAGAWGFAISDLAVSRQQFVQKSPINALWGTPLYFLSQMLLALSVAL